MTDTLAPPFVPDIPPQLQPAEYLQGADYEAAYQAERDRLGQHWSFGWGETIYELKSVIDNYRASDAPPAVITIYQNHLQESTEKARQSLRKSGYSDVADMEDAALQDELIEDHKQFLDAVENRQPELEAVKQRFIERVGYAIDHQGLPLTHEQLNDRVSDVQIGFRSKFLNSVSPAGYNLNSHSITVSANVTSDRLPQVGFHELLHTASGKRLVREDNEALAVNTERSRIGLSHPHKNREWASEATTDLLANILLDEKGIDYDLGSETMSLTLSSPNETVLGVMQRLPEGLRAIYPAFKLAAANAFVKIPAKVSLRAYFAQDRDPFEEDQMAGTHAERDLQRAIKINGGKEMIAKLRIINRAFAAGNENGAGQVARELRDETYLATDGSKLIRAREARQHTKEYQGRIERAKRLASRGQS